MRVAVGPGRARLDLEQISELFRWPHPVSGQDPRRSASEDLDPAFDHVQLKGIHE